MALDENKQCKNQKIYNDYNVIFLSIQNFTGYVS